MCKIIEYTDRYKTPLRTFLRNTYPTYSEEYLDYIVNSISDQRPSLLIINDDDEIVGGHHYYCTKALVNGVIIDTFWGHDTYIKQEYRKEIGLDFILTVHSIPGFGIGLTDINKVISKKIGKTFFSGVFTYYTINLKIVFSPILKLFKHSPKIDDRDVKVCGNIFRKINDGRIPYIPNDGFWYKGYKDIDFIRNADFLEKRFFANNVYK